MSAPQSRVINAVVLTAGLMEKTVKVRVGGQKWNKHVRKVRYPLHTACLELLLSGYALLKEPLRQRMPMLIVTLQYFNYPKTYLVHDPRSSLRAGDIIEISPGWRVSKHVRHVVSRIIAPFGEPIEARPSVMTEVERLEERRLKREAKDLRKGKIGAEGKIAESA
ncbi:hypothetical protein V492_04785 [Pseudogymnoascus sp. VKM F-4246]|nr:hypothetical protein V492_04785 [Pseudogymnoascus sp. VKM F-4246]